ncbi:MAG: ClpXP protease specificity-enhancing factor SspB [Neisseriaceae bacterium]
MLPADFKPYLLRGFYHYLVDRGLTPYIHVFVNELTQVPLEFVENNTITLNVSSVACSNFFIDESSIQFQARFAGKIQSIYIPTGHILAIYAREDTQLVLTFELEEQTKPSDTRYPLQNKGTRPALSANKKKDASSKLSNHLKVVKKNPQAEN